MTKPTIYVSAAFFTSIEHKIDLESIVYKEKVTHLITIKGKPYCLCGAVGTGTGIGWQSMTAYKVIPLENYKCKKAPLRYREHFAEVDKGIRERSYDGLLLNYQNKQVVLLGPEIEILPVVKLSNITQLKISQEIIIKHSELLKYFIPEKKVTAMEKFDKWLRNLIELNITYKYLVVDKAGNFINEWTFKKTV